MPLSGTKTDLVTLSVDVNSLANNVTITITGPSNVWFGVAFNATEMQDTPWAIIVYDVDGKVMERQLADHNPGSILQGSVTVLSNTVTGGRRKVVLQRGLKGLTKSHYTFSAQVGSIPFLNALGSTAEFAFHANRSASTLSLFPVSAGIPSCLCAGSASTINGIPYGADCRPEPLSDLLVQNNPTCQVSSYVGGLACCVDGSFLLDADQTPPPHIDNVFFKVRFYYEDYKPMEHQPTYHIEWCLNGGSTAHWPSPYWSPHVEFDIVKGVSDGGAQNVQMLQSTFQIYNMFLVIPGTCSLTDPSCMGADNPSLGPQGIKLVMAATHCHAPNCLRQELMFADTNETICVGTPEHGTSSDIYNEAGYLFSPPCTWGDTAGYQPPPVLALNRTLRMVTYYNSTYGHPGQMGIFQMRAVFA